MYKCIKCNKQFRYESKLNEHKNRKSACNEIKQSLDCELCKIKFKCKAEKIRHEETKKHIFNMGKLKEENNIDNILLEESNILELKIYELENIIKNLEIKTNNKIQELEQENINLKNKIMFLENENINLKLNNKIHSNNEYIYIMHCAQYINSNIYKIGRTKNLMNRFKQYPKESDMLFSINCSNSKQIESKILYYLKSNNNYIWYKDAGNEYFQCDLENLKMDILKIISDNKN